MNFLSGIISILICDIEVNGFPIGIVICSAIGGLIGAFSCSVTSSYLVQFENDYISAADIGQYSIYLLLTVIAIIQNPGSDSDVTFTPQVFFGIYSIILFPPIISYMYITFYKIGLREPLDVIEIIESNQVEAKTKFSLISSLTSDWFLKALPYFLVLAWIDLNLWSPLSSFLPYVFLYCRDSNSLNSALYLSIAFQAASFASVLGAIVTTWVDLSFTLLNTIFTGMVIVLYIGATNVSSTLDTNASGIIMIILFCGTSFIEAYTTTQALRIAGTEFKIQDREAVGNLLGLANPWFSLIGSAVSFIVLLVIIPNI